MTWIGWGLGVLLGLYGLHHLGLWAQDRGWIYYSKGHGGGGLGNALQELQTLIEPGQRHAIEERRKEDQEGEEEGDPPMPRRGSGV